MKRKPMQAVISATEARRTFGQVIRRVYNTDQHLIVEKDGLPVLAILSINDYEDLMRERGLKAFNKFTQAFGREVEKRGLSEEELMQAVEESKEEVYRETYGDL